MIIQNNFTEFVVVSKIKLKFLSSPDGNGNPFLRARRASPVKKIAMNSGTILQKKKESSCSKKKILFKTEKDIIFGSKFCLKLHFRNFSFDD